MVDFRERFTGHDWARYAGIASRSTCVSSFAVGIISIIFGYSFLVSLWTILCGLILAIWEFPFIYKCIPIFSAAESYINEVLRMKWEEAKAIMFVVLSIICFWQSTPCIAVGILLEISGVLYCFAAINRRVDIADGTRPAHSSQSSSGTTWSALPTHVGNAQHGGDPRFPGQGNSLLNAATQFGTF